MRLRLAAALAAMVVIGSATGSWAATPPIFITRTVVTDLTTKSTTEAHVGDKVRFTWVVKTSDATANPTFTAKVDATNVEYKTVLFTCNGPTTDHTTCTGSLPPDTGKAKVKIVSLPVPPGATSQWVTICIVETGECVTASTPVT